MYIVVDMEGISGIATIQQVSLGQPEFAEGRRLLAGDVDAAVAGAFDAGAERVVVCDFHDSRRNFPIADMDPRAEYEVPHGSLMPGLRSDFDAVIVVGMHAMSGTARGFLEHTVEPAWHRYWINGAECGELALLVYSAGALGVPVVFVSGDQAAVAEARALVPSIEGVIVKEGIARHWCRAMSPGQARALIRAGVTRSLGEDAARDMPQLRFPVPVQLEFNRCSDADAFDGHPTMTRIDGFTVRWTARCADELQPPPSS
ncbi:MAG: M55 family metallopeptidase [Chloroflexi bacterium]|nr:M55 family metallopeptidase [Chloroflexota bacterium]